MFALNASLPKHVDGNAVMHALNVVHKDDALKRMVTPKGDDVVVLVRKGTVVQHKVLDQCLLWFTDAKEMLDVLGSLGCAVVVTKATDDFAL